MDDGPASPMGILPGGTGNGFSREIGIPRTLREATEFLCTSHRTRPSTSAGSATSARRRSPTATSSSGMYLGIEPEQQTSREQKDRFGVFAYLVNATQHAGERMSSATASSPTTTRSSSRRRRIYVVNSGMMGSGLRIIHWYSIDDGLFDCFLRTRDLLDTDQRRGPLPGPSQAKVSRYHRRPPSI